MVKPVILAIDDDHLVLNSYEMLFQDNGIEVHKCSSGLMGLQAFRENPSKYPVILLDYDMTDRKTGKGINGDIVAADLKKINKKAQVIMVSGNNAPEVIQACYTAGADHFIVKSSATSKFCETVSAIFFAADSVVEEQHNEQERVEKIRTTLKMEGRSRELARVADLVELFCNYDEPVLILGESGVGKEGIATAIHRNSRRRNKKFVAVNCTAIGKDLLESELFGHERGSFTGAVSKKIGLFEQADGGTIFLDEIGDMSFDLQSKLLRTLQEKVVHPVGGTAKSVDFRVVCATHKNLKQAVEQGTFRQDLYFRIKFFMIEVPSLRERPEDIEPLVFHFLNSISEKMQKKKQISQGALRILKSHNWPGNVRNLEGVVKQAYAISDEKITPEDIQQEIGEDGYEEISSIQKTNHLMNYSEFESRMLEAERSLLNRALKRTGNVKKSAASILGISANTLQYRLIKLGIENELTIIKGGSK